MSESINTNLVLEAQASKKNERVINYIATKEIVDSMGRLFLVSGMDLSYLKKFKSIYYNHNKNDLPIGKANSVRKSGDEVRIAVEYAKMEENSFADTVYKLVRAGYINGGSIGITASMDDVEFPEKMKHKGKQVKMLVKKSKLHEFSITPNPANDGAVPLNASLDKAVEEGVIDELEANEFKIILRDAKVDDNTEEEHVAGPNPEQTINEDVVSLQARIAELELQLKEQEAEEESQDSVYAELYDEFIDTTESDDNQDEDSWMSEFLK